MAGSMSRSLALSPFVSLIKKSVPSVAYLYELLSVVLFVHIPERFSNFKASARTATILALRGDSLSAVITSVEYATDMSDRYIYVDENLTH